MMFLKEVEILRLMSETLEDHAKCNELCKLANERKCLWPLYHQTTASLKEKGEICGIPVLDTHETVAAGLSSQTRANSRRERTNVSVEPTPVSRQQLAKLVERIHSDMQDEVFSPVITAVIEQTRKLLDLTAVSVSLRKPDGGYIKVAATTSEDVVQAIRSIPVRSLNDVPNQLLIDQHKEFLRRLEIETKCYSVTELKVIDPKDLLKMFFDPQKDLFQGIEKMLQAMAVSCIKHSCESVLESTVSVFENHFDERRNLDEGNATDEFKIAVNGPNLAHSDPMVKEAMDGYWGSKKSGWHFYRTIVIEQMQRYEGGSKVVSRLMKKPSNLPFMKI